MATTADVPNLVYQLLCRVKGDKENSKSLAYQTTMVMFQHDKQSEVTFTETDEFYMLESLKEKRTFLFISFFVFGKLFLINFNFVFF